MRAISPVILGCLLMGKLPAADRNISFTAQPVGSPTVPTVVTAQANLLSADSYVVEDSPDLKVWNRVSPVLRPGGSTVTWSATHNVPHALHTLTLYGGTWHKQRFYRFKPLAPAGSPGGGGSPQGRLALVQAGVWEVTTGGGWKIRVNSTQGTVIITAPNTRDKVELWGGGNIHENLNGKHMKDWFSDARTVIIPGDASITATRANNPAISEITIKTVSIYDADQSHRIDLHSGTITLSHLQPRVGEAAEPDGETCRFWDAGNGAYLENIYTQEAAGNTGQPIPQTHVPIGKTGGDANPNQVNDFFDDPRLGHT
ncbi:MAG: hypothetical protein EOP85_09520 [Verrucomicrobiaceae bacterium]|nr:MAG: hypothetical protein EOP85_09520 [Verrucomicrobiaceae bacterium]